MNIFKFLLILTFINLGVMSCKGQIFPKSNTISNNINDNNTINIDEAQLDLKKVEIRTEYPIQTQASETTSIGELGSGYNKETKLTVGKCIYGTHEYIGKQEGSLGLVKEEELESFDAIINAAMNGKYGSGSFSSRVKAAYNKSSHSSKYGLSLTFRYRAKMKDAQFKMIGLTKSGKSAQEAMRWTETCGHEFISRVERGAQLLINLKFNFANESARSVFKASANISAGSNGLNIDLGKNSEKIKQHSSVVLTIEQIGGNVGALGDSVKSENIVNCSITNLEKCKEAVKDAIEYASKNFESQLDESLNNKSKGPAVFKTHHSDYSTLGIFPPEPIEDALVNQAREKLNQMVKNDLEFWAALNTVIKIKGETEDLKTLSENVNDNLALVSSAIEICYKKVRLKNCQDAVADISDKRTVLNSDHALLELTIKDSLKFNPIGLADAIENGEISVNEARSLACKFSSVENKDYQDEFTRIRNSSPENWDFCLNIEKNKIFRVANTSGVFVTTNNYQY